MKKTARKVLLMACSALLLVCLTVGATVAYLTSTTGPVTNTFTVGNVTITLDEADVNEYGEEIANADRVIKNEYKLMPGHEYKKDPTVHVGSESEKAYLFVKVVNGISAIEAAGDTTIAAQMKALGWKATSGDPSIFYLSAGAADDATAAKIVEAGKDYVVFNNFKIATDADVSNYATIVNGQEIEANKITIKACAVQEDGVNLATATTEAIAKLNADE